MEQPTAFALFQIGTQTFGVADAHVVQAVVYPADLTPMPRTTGALHGVFMHRGQLVPLVDLGQWMGQSMARGGTGGEVLILQSDGVFTAIRVDAVKGLRRAQAGAVRPVSHDSSAAEFFHSVLVSNDGETPIVLLDPQRLAAQSQVWCQTDPLEIASTATAALATTATHSRTAPLAIFQLGSTYVAVSADAVGEVSGGLTLQRMAGLGADFLGMTLWRGHDVPVLNLAHTLGLGTAQATQSSWLVLLQHDNRRLGFYVQALVSVGPVDTAAAQDTVELSDALKRVSSGSVVVPGIGRVHLLNADALMDSSPLSLAAVGQAAADARQPGAVLPGNLALLENKSSVSTGALVVLRSARTWAASLASMLQIIRPDAAQRQALQQGVALPGAMEWRNQSIALTDLRVVQGQPATTDGEDVRIIVIDAVHGPRGLLVESVDALIPGHLGVRSLFRAAGAVVEMITVGQGTEQHSYQIIALERMGTNAVLV